MGSCATAFIFYGINLGDGNALQKKFPEINFDDFGGGGAIEEMCKVFKLEDPKVKLEFCWDTYFDDIFGAFLYVDKTHQMVSEYESEPLQDIRVGDKWEYNNALKPFAEKLGVEFDPKFWVSTCNI